jgi:glycerophosphoryl diester phosphodiesterase
MTPTRPVARIAHHGNSYGRLENTLDASASAMKIGCDWLEPDVQTTYDGHIVALHDETILTRRVRYRHLTTRDQNKLKPTQAQTSGPSTLASGRPRPGTPGVRERFRLRSCSRRC